MTRRYHHIISLGLNCEPSYALEDMSGRLDSYPLSWALVPDIPNLLRALGEMNSFFSEGYDIACDSFDMFRCKRVGIQFHGKTDLRSQNYHSEAIEAAFDELVSRMRHLNKKFYRALSSGRDILCIVKNHSWEGAPRVFSTREALAVKAALDRLAEGSVVEVLFVDRKARVPLEFEPRCLELGIHKRLVDAFAPGERAYLYDLPGWARIFAEFDSVHSPFMETDIEERTQAIQRHLSARRETRLRDNRERTRKAPCAP